MKRVAVLACAVSLAGVAALSSGGGLVRAPVLGVIARQGSDRMVWLDPLSLRPLGSRFVEIPSFAYWDRSPSGSRVVLGGRAGTLWFVNPVKLRIVGAVGLRGFSDPRLAWVAPRALLVVDQASIALVDPAAMRVEWRKTLPESVRPFLPEQEARGPSGLVLLVPPLDGSVGDTTLVNIDVSGRVRSVVLAQIQSGTEDPAGNSLFHGSEPGLAVDPVGNTAYVVEGDGAVAAVDLVNMTVSYHDPPRTLAHADKVLAGPTRDAVWLGNGLLAVTGANANGWLDTNNAYQETVDPAGLTIVDTRTWTARLVDPRISSVTFADGLLMAAGESWDTTTGSSASKPIGTGLSAYTAAGVLVFHLLGQAPVQQVFVTGGDAYALGPRTMSVVKLASEAVLNTLAAHPATAPTPLLELP